MGSQCGIPEIKRDTDMVDPWTVSKSGCECLNKQGDFSCACCVDEKNRQGCQCKYNTNQCVQCGSPQDCGKRPDIFGENPYCLPQNCPRRVSMVIAEDDPQKP
jgi:hypothetical protein